jgi:hypothetical protein
MLASETKSLRMAGSNFAESVEQVLAEPLTPGVKVDKEVIEMEDTKEE